MRMPEKNQCRAACWPKYMRSVLLLTVFTLAACYPASRRYQPDPQANPEITRKESRVLHTQVYYYPKEGQNKEQQSRDHYECYFWAVRQTGFDPNMYAFPQKEQVKVVPVPAPGYDTAAMAIGGAVMGALIAGPRHAAGGALVGAAGGAMVGAASDISRQNQARELEEAYARKDQPHSVQIEQKALDFRRAMSACLEGRGYSVK
ncbi:MAG: hypothetical protein Q8P24_19125 [Desulfobacterales bacterium]|nr:hypothetical protein [Desulfobacterales bacterium]